MGGIDMPNLGGWYPQMVFETITDERGNEIYIAVEDGLKGVHIVIRGPESEARITITRLEAKALLRCLSDAVGRRSTPPSVPTDELVERAAIRLCALDLGNEGFWKTIGEEDRNTYRDEARDVLTAALAVQPGSGWRPIAEAPTTGRQIILYGHWKQFHGTEHEAGSNHVNCGHYANGWVCEGRYDEQFIATHWQPLPAPPTAQEGSNG